MNYVAHQYLKGISGQTTQFKWLSTCAGADLYLKVLAGRINCGGDWQTSTGYRFVQLLLFGYLNNRFPKHRLNFSQRVNGKVMRTGHPFADLTLVLPQQTRQVLLLFALFCQDFVDPIHNIERLPD